MNVTDPVKALVKEMLPDATYAIATRDVPDTMDAIITVDCSFEGQGEEGLDRAWAFIRKLLTTYHGGAVRQVPEEMPSIDRRTFIRARISVNAARKNLFDTIGQATLRTTEEPRT